MSKSQNSHIWYTHSEAGSEEMLLTMTSALVGATLPSEDLRLAYSVSAYFMKS